MNIELGIGIGGGTLASPTQNDRLVAFAWAMAGAPNVITSTVIHKSVTSVPANSNISALVPIISNADNVNVLAVIVNVNSVALIPSVAIAGSISINAVVANGNTDSLIPVVSTIRNVTVGGVIANSTASTGIPNVTVGGGATTYYLQMDGVDDYISAPNNDSFNIGTNYSIKAVVAFDTAKSGWNVVVGKDHWTGGTGWLLYRDGNTLRFDKAGSLVISANFTFNNGQFYTIESISDGVNLMWKIDGNIIKTIATPSIPDNSVTLNIGARHLNGGTGTTDFFKGNMKQLTIIKNSVVSVDYDFTTGTVQDQSGNGNHGTLTGGTWVVA